MLRYERARVGAVSSFVVERGWCLSSLLTWVRGSSLHPGEILDLLNVPGISVVCRRASKRRPGMLFGGRITVPGPTSGNDINLPLPGQLVERSGTWPTAVGMRAANHSLRPFMEDGRDGGDNVRGEHIASCARNQLRKPHATGLQRIKIVGDKLVIRALLLEPAGEKEDEGFRHRASAVDGWASDLQRVTNGHPNSALWHRQISYPTRDLAERERFEPPHKRGAIQS